MGLINSAAVTRACALPRGVKRYQATQVAIGAFRAERQQFTVG